MRKEVTIVAGVIDPGNQEQIGCCYIKGQGRVCLAFTCSMGASLGTPLPDMRISMTIMVGDRCGDQGVVSLGMRAWVTLPGKLPRKTEVLA